MKRLIFLLFFPTLLFADFSSFHEEFLKKLSVVSKRMEYQKRVSFFEGIIIRDLEAVINGYCFFGGWPSKYNGRYCQHPSAVKNDPDISKISKYKKCPNRKQFRCNPLVFGAMSDGEGKCISKSSWNGITNQCIQATEKLRNEEYIERVKDDVCGGESKYLAFVSETREFCRWAKYGGCDELNKLIDENQTLLGHNSINKSNEVLCQSRLTASVEVNSEDCVNCESARPSVSVPLTALTSAVTPASITAKILTYEESDEAKEAIKWVNKYYSCDWPLRGNPPERLSDCPVTTSRSKGKCLQHVSWAFASVGAWSYENSMSGRREFKKNYPGENISYAVNSGEAFFEPNGFINIMEYEPYKSSTIDELYESGLIPNGAAIIYGAGEGEPGHVEIFDKERNRAVSDFIQVAPLGVSSDDYQVKKIYIKDFPVGE